MEAKFTRHSDLDLPEEHPATVMGRGPAFRCSECKGFFFPIGEPTTCPYCEEDSDS